MVYSLKMIVRHHKSLCRSAQLFAVLQTFCDRESSKSNDENGEWRRVLETTAVLVSIPFDLEVLTQKQYAKSGLCLLGFFSSDQAFVAWQDWGTFTRDNVTFVRTFQTVKRFEVSR